MLTVVPNLDSQPGRWRSMVQHLAGFGIVPVRFRAEPATGRSEWYGADLWDVAKCQAVTRTYRRLMRHLQTVNADRFMIVQDDIRFTQPPHPTTGVHLCGGYRLHTYRHDGQHLVQTAESFIVDPTVSDHVCPKAFTVTAGMLPLLEDAWTDETRQACETWTPLLIEATFDEVPIADDTIH